MLNAYREMEGEMKHKLQQGAKTRSMNESGRGKQEVFEIKYLRSMCGLRSPYKISFYSKINKNKVFISLILRDKV